MKPNNTPKSPCINTPSGCVIWDGPTIECVGICNGDSITTAVYELAKKLCDVMDQLNITNYDLSCLEPSTCKPTNFKAFIQLLIDKVCLTSSELTAGGNYVAGQTYILTTDEINALIDQGYQIQILT